MAFNPIEIERKVGEKISGDHNVVFGVGKTYFSVSIKSSADATSKTAMSEFQIETLNIYKTAVLDSMLFTFGTDHNKDYNTLKLKVEGQYYSINTDGNLSNEGINALNNYKSNNGIFPRFTLQVTTIVYRPSPAEDGSEATAYSYFDPSTIIIGLRIDGGTLILRPSGDVQVEHTIPEGFTGIYQLIDDEVADDDATQIGYHNTGTSLISQTSIVRLPVIQNNKIKVVDGFICTRAKDSGGSDITESYTVEVIANDETILTQTSSTMYSTYANYKKDLYSLQTELAHLNSLIKNNDALELQLKINTTTKGYDRSSSGGYKTGIVEAEVYITQIYLVLHYENKLNIYSKNNEAWEQATAAYKKQNGAWISIIEEEAQTILSSKLVIDKCAFRGHIETPIADIEATCTEDGATGGIKCSYCGKIVKEHDIVIPARHSYYSHGICRECSAESPDRIRFTIQRSTQESAHTFYSMPNLTWGEWVNNYPMLYGDTIWQITSDGSVRYYYEGSTSTTDYTIDGVKSTDLIIAGHAYTATDATTS